MMKGEAMQPRTSFYRALSLLGYLGLLSWMCIWYFILVDTEYSMTFIAMVYILPLLFPMVGILKGKPYTHAWSCFIVLLYLMHGITAWYSIPEQWLYACIEIILSVIMFTGCSMYARLRGQELGHSLPKLKQVMDEEKQRFESKS